MDTGQTEEAVTMKEKNSNSQMDVECNINLEKANQVSKS